jgi:hypothetical protein
MKPVKLKVTKHKKIHELNSKLYQSKDIYIYLVLGSLLRMALVFLGRRPRGRYFFFL